MAKEFLRARSIPSPAHLADTNTFWRKPFSLQGNVFPPAWRILVSVIQSCLCLIFLKSFWKPSSISLPQLNCLIQAVCDKYAYDLERAELQHQKAQGGLDKSQEEVARLQVELEKLYDKHDKTEMELRQTHTQLEKYKEETATLEAEVDRFAGRMGKYQVRSHQTSFFVMDGGFNFSPSG